MAEPIFEVTVLNKSKTDTDVKIHHRRHQSTPDHKTVKKNEKKKFTLNHGAPREKEYLVIDLDHAPGECPGCKVMFAENTDFTFIPSGAINLHIAHVGVKTVVEIPAMSPGWKLKIAVPKGWKPGTGGLESQNVTLAADEPGRPD
jgi:hypothetical protein